MKTQSSQKRRVRRNVWGAKNLRLIRAALRVWELRQRQRGAP